MVRFKPQEEKWKSVLLKCYTSRGKHTTYFSCSIARIYLNAELLSLLPQPADKVPQPHDVITVIYHRQPFTHTKKPHTPYKQTLKCS